MAVGWAENPYGARDLETRRFVLSANDLVKEMYEVSMGVTKSCLQTLYYSPNVRPNNPESQE